MKPKLIDLTGQRFGRLTVIEKTVPYKSNGTHATRWLCQCDCGRKTAVTGGNLKRGYTKSCGCLRRELSSQRLRAAYDAVAIVNEMGEKSERII